MKRYEIIKNALFGGPGSGHYSHKGVPGKRGGSAPSGGGAKQIRDILTPLGMEEYDEVTLQQVAESIDASGKVNPKMEPFGVQLWRITGKRKRKVEFSVSYRIHPLGLSGNFHTTKMSIPMQEP